MKKFLCLLMLLISSNVFSQETEQMSNDSLKIVAVKNFQDLFWLNPIKHYGWVTDYEKIFSKDQIKNINKILDDFEKQTSNEIVIVTLDSLRTTNENFEDLSLRIAQKWGIGKVDKDNGILIALSKHYRKIRIQNGNGIEKIISDEETKVILDKFFIPEFKKDEYYNGTLNGVLEIINKLK